MLLFLAFSFLGNLIISVCVLAYGIYRYYKFVWNYPKGPFPLPFIGNLRELDFDALHKSLRRLGRSQNDLYTLFTPFPIVQITDYGILREAFIENGDDFTGRPQNKIIQEVFSFAPNSGVINSTGEVWRQQRRAAISIMRDFGMGKNLMEGQVSRSIEDYLHLESIPDKSNVDMRWPIQVMVANVINEVLFGYRYKYDDCKPLMDYVLGLNELISTSMTDRGVGLAMVFPSLTKIPFVRWLLIGRAQRQMQKLNKYISDSVERAMKSYNTEDEPTCFVHAYKQRMRENKHLDDLNLLATCSDFFFAGQETTTTTLRWAMLILAKHCEVQDKLRREILAVVGTDRLPSMADPVRMPYTRACVLEVQRFANVLGTNVMRTTVRDVTIRGQTIPEGTWVNGDIHFVMANDPIFVNPQEFRPKRYLAKDGTSLNKDLVDRTLPFSIGKRACAGESLARVELFLGLTATVQHYRILPREGAEIDLEPAMVATTLRPKAQGLRQERMS